MVLQFIDHEEFTRILEKPTLTQQDIFKINSYPFKSLAEKCGDIKPGEMNTVRELAEQNIKQFFNTITIVLGMQHQDRFRHLLTVDPYPMILSALKEEYSGNEFLMMATMMITKVMLTQLTGSYSSARPVNIKLDGKMPQKFMSFRQMNGDEWFSSYLDIKLYSFKCIFEKCGLEAAIGHLMASVAYSLYYNNPTKYYISACHTEDEALHKILNNALTGKNDNVMQNYNQKGELLFKDI